MKRNKNIKNNLKKYFEELNSYNLSIKEKAAFEMLRQKKIRKLLNKDEH